MANLVHLLGLVLLVGGIGLLDLRLAGAFPGLPVRPLSQALVPAAVVGLALLASAGVVMFAADAQPLARSSAFRWKLGLIALGLAHAALFHLLWRGRMARWEDDPPALGRFMAGVSVLLWLTVAALGRLIAYT